MTAPQIIRTPSGEELVVLTRAEYEALIERVDHEAEDEDDVAIYDARTAELAAGRLGSETDLMVDRTATCRCGQLRVECAGDPVRVSVCHCLDCQKRTGSAFAAQARWPEKHVQVIGKFREWSYTGDSGGRATFWFCALCGSTVAFVNDGMPGVIAIPIGAFADPKFPSPRFSVYEERKHAWVAVLGDDVEHQE